MLTWAVALVFAQVEKPYRLTPGPPPEPMLTGPTVVGTRPMSPASHWLTATGKAPITFTASGLPPGYRLDGATGELRGSVGFPGNFRVKVTATNRVGSDSRDLRIVVGDTLALTPPMGIEAPGSRAEFLRGQGWSYSAAETPGFKVIRMEGDIKRACQFRFAGKGLVVCEALAEKLKGAGFDIVLSLTNVVPLAEAAAWSKLANTWRTNAPVASWTDITETIRNLDAWAPFAKAGHWNDPGPLLLAADSPLTPNEKYSQVSLWCLWSAPLWVPGDASTFDDFTLSLLTNQEVLAIGQDSLGNQARLTNTVGEFEVWSKSLEDGGMAIGIFNKGDKESESTLEFVSVVGGVRLRDVWRQNKVGLKKNAVTFKIPRHGVRLLRTNKIAEFRLRVGPPGT